MLKTRSRLGVFNRPVKFREFFPYKIAVPSEVAVRNPVTGKDEVTTVLTFKEESVVDSHLRASDFALDVLIRQDAVKLLRDCGKYFQPSTPEEYMEIVSNFSSLLDSQKSIVEPALDPTAVPTPDSSEPSK